MAVQTRTAEAKTYVTERKYVGTRELDDFLRKKGVAHVFLAGVDSAMSIKQTAHSALDMGYRVTFIQDGIFTAYESRWERCSSK